MFSRRVGVTLLSLGGRWRGESLVEKRFFTLSRGCLMQKVTAGPSTLNVTDKAVERMNEIFTPGDVLRLEIEAGGCSGFQYKFSIDSVEEFDDEEDIMITDGQGESGIAVDQTTLSLISGSTIDYVEEMVSSSFRVIGNPHADLSCSCGASFSAK